MDDNDTETRPNVLFILSDQHHAGLMGCSGDNQAITPNLDQLAQDGLRFDQAYTQNPICTPSRVSFLSGQAPLNHGMFGLSGPTPAALPSIFGHFRAKMEELQKTDWLFEPKDLQSALKRVWRGYLACITQCDWAVGEMVKHLKDKGLFENTIVVYSCDHGAYHGIYGIPEKAPGICSEAVCKIPWIMSGYGVEERGSTRSGFIQNSDLAPTLCTLRSLSLSCRQ